MKFISSQSLRTSVVFLIVALASGCASAPTQAPTPSFGLTDTGDTFLGKTVAPLVAQHPNQSGLYPMSSGLDAFGARLALADAAEKSLDVQYYIWDGDTGRLLASRLLAAADRGVRVRALLDDQGLAADDETLRALDSHPNIEVRLFNPVAFRMKQSVGMFLDFARYTRRMHNKSFNADNQVAIIGGRNIGDEYFQATPVVDYADMDVVAVGPVVPEVTKSFDLYWNCAASIPVANLDQRVVAPDALAKARTLLDAHVETMKNSPYVSSPQHRQLTARLGRQEVSLYWGDAQLLYDLPEKVTARSEDAAVRLLPRLISASGEVHKELLVVSPYFIPGPEGVKFFGELCKRGVRVVILTNSLGSTDVLPVHAAYTKYRMDLVKAGVELYELKPTAALRGKSREGEKQKMGGSSNAGLHAKCFVRDRELVFVGSMNLDPRSSKLNTEIGVVFQNDAMARDMADSLESKLKELAWRVEPVKVHVLFWDTVEPTWVTQEDGKVIRSQSEPNQTLWRNLYVTVVQWLPIEQQL